MIYKVEQEIAGRTLTIETGKLAVQANGAVRVSYGETVLLVTACMSPAPREGVDFLPLTVDFEERLYAAGKIPGSFFRREGRPSQEAILAGRLTDRPIRPLFPKGFRNDVQVIATVLSADQENSPEPLAIVGAAAALCISEIPFDTPVGACRVGYLNGEYIINPTYAQSNQSQLNMVVASTRDAILMVEAGANEVPEEVVLEGMRRAQQANNQVIQMIEELVRMVGKPKVQFTPPAGEEEVEKAVREAAMSRIQEILEHSGVKTEREAALSQLETELRERFTDQFTPEAVSAAFQSLLKELVRTRILRDKVRPDGRDPETIRPITCEVGVLPRTHGSGIFTRGLTQVLSIVTLGSMGMEQTLDTLSPDETKRFMHHYNFPPYSTGEVKRIGSPGRREVGHGALAERALLPVIPPEETFPYTVRIVSEVLSSNGSTSMASVCGSTLALMDAGVPIKKPVGGVAMGLVMGEDGNYTILTDIEGIEDQLGDMDFKVAGTDQGVTAVQMDIKVKGLTFDILSKALEQARRARLFILDKMAQTISAPRPQLSRYAPKMFRMVIPVDKIGAVIGSGGRTIRSIIEETGATIDIEDDGTVIVGSTDETKARMAMGKIEALTRELAVGDIFTGRVTRVTNFGAFVELLPGREGLVRNAELGDLEDGIKVGQEISVMVTEIDSLGRVNLSRKALFRGGPEEEGAAPSQPRRPGPPPGGFRQRPAPYRGGDRGPGPRREGRPPGPGGGPGRFGSAGGGFPRRPGPGRPQP